MSTYTLRTELLAAVTHTTSPEKAHRHGNDDFQLRPSVTAVKRTGIEERGAQRQLHDGLSAPRLSWIRKSREPALFAVSGKFVVTRRCPNTKTRSISLRCVMEVLDCAAAVSPDGRAVVFMLSIHGREVKGAIARAALEEHFWLPRGADPTRTLKTFEAGRNRIVAVVQRKLLTWPNEPLRLTVNDFVTRWPGYVP
jgi:Protein of unknown function (DUF1488)